MPCIKTGAHIFVEPYNEYCWCDTFAIDPVCNVDDRMLARDKIQIDAVYLFRIVKRSFTPLDTRLHFTVHNFDEWFDKGNSHPDTHEGCSTTFAAQVTNHGYNGKEI